MSEPDCTADACIQLAGRIMSGDFTPEGKTQKARAVFILVPEIDTQQCRGQKIMAGLFKGFADGCSDQGFTRLQMAGGLVMDDVAINFFFHEQKTAVLFQDAGDGGVWFPWGHDVCH